MALVFTRLMDTYRAVIPALRDGLVSPSVIPAKAGIQEGHAVIVE